MQIRDRLYVGGRWLAPCGGETIEVVNPASEAVIARIPAGNQDDANGAVESARAALEAWGALPLFERLDFLERLLKALSERSEEIAQTISAEVGMPLKLSRKIQAGLPTAVLESTLGVAREFPFEESVGHSLVWREPVGVVACITPWNYPLHQAMAKIAPALSAGCTVVLKPSELAPLSTFILAEAAESAGLPSGVFNLVTGYGPVVGEALASHPGVDMISFTGSTAAGRRVTELASRTVKRTALELGGKSAAVVLQDADLQGAVKGTIASCFLNSGQTCSAHTRLLVPASLHEEAAALAAETAALYAPGDPLDPATRLGPLVSSAQRERVLEYIRKGINEGARLVAGGLERPAGPDRGYFVQPTVFAAVRPEMVIAREEIFGPVLCVLPYDSEEEAVTIANDTPYGLAAGVWSGDQERATRLARRLKAGQVDINGAHFNILAPFGGVRQSGYGREFGRYGLEEFLVTKSVQIERR